ncbi:MAG: polyphosphate polymerase domain-containing protein [Nocardioidaceae bacterium]
MTDTLSSVLSALPPVGLPELDEQAALLTRVDRKYVVPAADLPLLCAGLSARVLEIDGRRRFGYASTYFDTPDLASFRGAAHKRRRRFKVRTREYIDTGTAWVEVKTRGPRGSTVKQRLPLDRTPEAGPLDAAACDFVGSALLRGGVVDIDPGELLPVLDTAFERSTLLLPASSSGSAPTRATLDAGLRWAAPDGQHLATGPVLVVETKAAPGSPGELDRRLWELGHRPARISKFCVGLALARPALPANRWHRTRPRLGVRADAAW